MLGCSSLVSYASANQLGTHLSCLFRNQELVTTNPYRISEVNKGVTDLHPTVLNPYKLLNSLSPYRIWYTVLDLKEAFFCLFLAPKSQEYFTFEWKNPGLGIIGQLMWAQLPQGFKNSPTISMKRCIGTSPCFENLTPR